MSEVNIIRSWLQENIMPFFHKEYLEAKHKGFLGQVLSDDDVFWLVAMGSHVGAILRVAYYKLVHKQGLPPWAFWDAVVQVCFFDFSIWHDWDLSRYPAYAKFLSRLDKNKKKWVEVGLKGTDWPKLKKMCEAFCKYMEELEAQEKDA